MPRKTTTQGAEWTDDPIAQMLRTNDEQAAFYDRNPGSRGNLPTRAWSRLRGAMMAARRNLGISEAVLDLHRQWMGDLSGKRVLDLGCYSGNALSLYLAGSAGYYLGIDLSSAGIQRLRARLDDHGLTSAEVRAVDFLSPEFRYEPFDLVYAYSVIHHFGHFDEFLRVLSATLKPGGQVVTMDPLNTWPPLRMARSLYRPFQSDSDWEHPSLVPHSQRLAAGSISNMFRGSWGMQSGRFR